MKETTSVLIEPVSRIKFAKRSNKKSKKRQRDYFILMVLSGTLGIAFLPYSIAFALPCTLSAIGFIKERQDYKSTNVLFTNHVKRDIAQMLENEDLAETLDLDNISIIPSNVVFL